MVNDGLKMLTQEKKKSGNYTKRDNRDRLNWIIVKREEEKMGGHPSE